MRETSVLGIEISLANASVKLIPESVTRPRLPRCSFPPVVVTDIRTMKPDWDSDWKGMNSMRSDQELLPLYTVAKTRLRLFGGTERPPNPKRTRIRFDFSMVTSDRS